jgi:hypothetical protein
MGKLETDREKMGVTLAGCLHGRLGRWGAADAGGGSRLQVQAAEAGGGEGRRDVRR